MKTNMIFNTKKQIKYFVTFKTEDSTGSSFVTTDKKNEEQEILDIQEFLIKIHGALVITSYKEVKR